VEQRQLEGILGRLSCDSEESNEKCLKGNGFQLYTYLIQFGIECN